MKPSVSRCQAGAEVSSIDASVSDDKPGFTVGHWAASEEEEMESNQREQDKLELVEYLSRFSLQVGKDKLGPASISACISHSI